ncbi:hypothetical protein [Botrimarina mediterranea]|uniref:Outer membrane efflux protein n=1 Tax=Botrimarina mediterranea TaxID=2528022 RepID=A0A518KBE4_9BACT|nr:hypothetical protein [Botrimarina mediterranea]QDV75103.1 hypothetical protein Spa11_33130 [Botrimarina mediterranea]QDV79748.1 hypothetical protein K2D_33640 [Planctomycetes bacterium K2D]
MKTDRINGAVWGLLTAGLVLMVSSGAAQAQRPQRFQPARPTVSPYLNLLRQNNSAIPNYYSLVRPELQQLQVNQQQQALLLKQNSQIQRLQTNLLKTQTEGPVSGTPSWFQTPGSRSTFLNTGQFFSRSGVAASR